MPQQTVDSAQDQMQTENKTLNDTKSKAKAQDVAISWKWGGRVSAQTSSCELGYD